MSDEDFRSKDPFVPERDDIRPRTSAPRQAPPREPHEARPGKTASRGKSSRTSPWPVIILLVAVIGLAAFSWHQSRILADLNSRFSQLSAKIESTDESLSQSGAALSLKLKEQEAALDEHWTEIKKLWGVSYDTNRKAIEANKTAIGDFKGRIDATESEVKKAQSAAAEARKQAVAASQSLETLRSTTLGSAAQMDELREKMAVISGTLNRLDSAVKQLNGLSGRVASNEEALRAIDAYRAQVNQQLAQLRQQLGQP